MSKRNDMTLLDTQGRALDENGDVLEDQARPFPIGSEMPTMSVSPDPLVYGLYESFSATCDVNLTTVSISHNHFVARNDEHALEIGRQKAGQLDVTVRRVADVRPMP